MCETQGYIVYSPLCSTSLSSQAWSREKLKQMKMKQVMEDMIDIRKDAEDSLKNSFNTTSCASSRGVAPYPILTVKHIYTRMAARSGESLSRKGSQNTMSSHSKEAEVKVCFCVELCLIIDLNQ